MPFLNLGFAPKLLGGSPFSGAFNFDNFGVLGEPLAFTHLRDQVVPGPRELLSRGLGGDGRSALGSGVGSVLPPDRPLRRDAPLQRTPRLPFDRFLGSTSPLTTGPRPGSIEENESLFGGRP